MSFPVIKFPFVGYQFFSITLKYEGAFPMIEELKHLTLVVSPRLGLKNIVIVRNLGHFYIVLISAWARNKESIF